MAKKAKTATAKKRKPQDATVHVEKQRRHALEARLMACVNKLATQVGDLALAIAETNRRVTALEPKGELHP